MAASIARAIGRSRAKETETTRLGHEESEAQANTFRTFATALTRKDGSGYVKVERVDPKTNERRSLGKIGFSPETAPDGEAQLGGSWLVRETVE